MCFSPRCKHGPQDFQSLHNSFPLAIAQRRQLFGQAIAYRTTWPEPDTLNRLAAARLVFCLGIGCISSRRSHRHTGVPS